MHKRILPPLECLPLLLCLIPELLTIVILHRLRFLLIESLMQLSLLLLLVQVRVGVILCVNTKLS